MNVRYIRKTFGSGNIGRRTFGLALGTALATSLLAGSASAASDYKGVKFLNIATATTGGSFYPAGIAISKVINDNIKVRASAQSSAGSVANTDLLRNNEANVGILQSKIAKDAIAGTGAFKDQGQLKLQVLMPLFINADHMIINTGSGIDDIKDVKGKRWAVDRVGSGTLSSAKDILESFGITFDDIKPQYIDQSEALSGVQNGMIDGAELTSGVPFSQLTETMMSANGKVKVLDLTPEEQQQIVKATG